MLTTSEANKLIRKQSKEGLTGIENSYLEEYLFNAKPTKKYAALVDKLLQYVYTDTEEKIIIGTCDSFNCPVNECYMDGTHNLMWKGKFIGEDETENYYRYEFTLERVCEERLKEIWKRG